MGEHAAPERGASESGAAAPEVLLQDGLQALGISTSDEQLSQLLRYLGEIERFNPRLGLVEAQGEALVRRHLLDCAAGVPVVRELVAALGEPNRRQRLSGESSADAGAEATPAVTLADLGSGAGLPGVVLAVLEPRLAVTLVERAGRRVGFLRNVRALLRLTNLEIAETTYERCSERFDIVTFRALTELGDRNAEIFARLLRPGGYLLAYKGRRQRAEVEAEALRGRFNSVELRSLNPVFLEEERCLVIAHRAED